MKLYKILRNSGIPHAQAQSIYDLFYEKNIENKNIALKRLLIPLENTIKNMGSGKHRWKKDEKRAELYDSYLTMLRMVKNKIHLAAVNTKIPDNARWPDYVPPHIKDKFVAAFDTLNAQGVATIRPFRVVGARVGRPKNI